MVRGVYNCRHVGSIRFNTILVPTSKFFCFFIPILSVVFPFAPFFNHRLPAALIISCAPSMYHDPSNAAKSISIRATELTRSSVFLGWLVGGVCIVAILIKYVRGLANFVKIENSRSVDISLQTSSTLGKGKMNHAISLTDKWLLLRFSFTFVCLW